ncbi:HpcH/HpaI aldolase/citrate lyase family protein [Penicillium subrubescens]|uniref:5-keto-4-deoxy-D-glucarate aldolase n=1 Tax=Penicillium subrubescens TaxID=1316194 RepID=A0A1Q5TUE8_9EURO|nr:HpcH/HpaI aldolase/citrate lyase family protein [Penicillium subrubescens]KAJ5911068.1 HpcH/HpaI aldolase/citrate lyase family protein [Penicillium subrubescens]OKP03823.1 5-keto-4-deoxy-D-glucarate aldolase [Penicillium subrubescens]
MERYRAASLFQPPSLVKALEDTMKLGPGHSTHLMGTIVSIPHTISARTLAVLGYDFVMIDAQHTPIEAENLVRLIQTVSLSSQGRTVPICRVPSTQSHLLTYALDAGAAGIIFPHIDTPEQAAEAVRKCRYAYSGGDRSLAPAVLVPGVTDIAPTGSSHAHVADDNLAVIIQIESPLALENADAIAAVPGVNALMLGAGDLRVAMRLPQQLGVPEDPKLMEAIDRLVRVSRRHQKPLAVVTCKVANTTNEWLKDFQLLMLTSDYLSVVKGHKEDLAQMTKNIAELHGLRN